MSKTVVGLFSSVAEAEKVKSELKAQGFDGSDITVHANGTGESNEGSSGTGIGEKINHFFSKLTGGDDETHEHYTAGVNAGGALLTATVADDEANEIALLLKQHGAKGIDGNERAASEGTPVYGGAASTELTGQTAIPIVEESLVVGKREVDRGGVRVYSHVVDRPVEADVTLRDEFINVERRFVDRPATAADFAAGSGAVLEVNATGEEAVVGKTSRVVEEVVVGKDTSHHTETVSDSVRKTVVDVENLDSSTTAPGGSYKDRY